MDSFFASFTSLSWDSCTIEGVPTLSCIWVVLSNVINFALGASAVVALFFIIFSGIKYITSRGDEEQIANAKKTLTYAIIGLVFILLSFTIFNFITVLTGVSPENITPPSNT